MAESHDARLVELVADLGGDEVRFLFRDLVQKALQELIDAELTEAMGVGPHERTQTRTNQRNGARSRVLSTREVMLNCGYRRCVRGRSSRRCWNRAAGWIGRCGR